MKKLLVGLSVGFGLSLAGAAMTTAVAHDFKVGVVDYMQVFKQAPQGDAKLAALKAEMKPKITALKASQAELMTEAKSLEKDAPTFTKKERKDKQGALAKKQEAFQGEVIALRTTEMKAEKAAAKNFEDALQASISSVAKTEHYSVILNKQAAPYTEDSLDVTQAVVKGMTESKS